VIPFSAFSSSDTFLTAVHLDGEQTSTDDTGPRLAYPYPYVSCFYSLRGTHNAQLYQHYSFGEVQIEEGQMRVREVR
jgi:hypothetical protein